MGFQKIRQQGIIINSHQFVENDDRILEVINTPPRLFFPEMEEVLTLPSPSDILESQDQADINMWVVFGGKDEYLKRQKEIIREVFA